MGFQVLTGQSFLVYLLGLFLGHMYIVIKDIYVPRYRKDYLPTPDFLYLFLFIGSKRWWYSRGGVGPEVRQGGENRGPGAFGGIGVRLG